MPNENETGISHEDAQSVAESLFGDTADHGAVAPSEEQDANKQTDQDQQGSDVAEDQTRGDETGPTNDLKVVVSIREGRATVGVQRPSSDPHIESFDDPDLSGLAQEVSAVIERARARWEDAPRHPAYARPAPTTGRRPRRERGSVQDSAVEEGAVQEQPQRLRLGLF